METLDRLSFIRQAQALNLTLAEIAEIVQLHNDRSACLKVQTILEQKIIEIDQRLAMLNEFRQTLMVYLSECQATLEEETDKCCPVLEDIAHSPQPQPMPMRKKNFLKPGKRV